MGDDPMKIASQSSRIEPPETSRDVHQAKRSKEKEADELVPNTSLSGISCTEEVGTTDVMDRLYSGLILALQ